MLLLSDGYLANGSEPWKLPDIDQLDRIQVTHPAGRNNGKPFLPYERNEKLARPWALPGTEGLMHRIGGLEFCIGVEIADGPHTRAFVEGFFHFRWKRNIFDQ